MKLFNHQRAIRLGIALAVFASAPGLSQKEPSQELARIRSEIGKTEKELVTALRDQNSARGRIDKLRKLVTLLREEQDLTRERLVHLEKFVNDLEVRRQILQGKVEIQRSAIRLFLMDLDRSVHRTQAVLPDIQSEAKGMPVRRLMAALVEAKLKDLEVLRVDLEDVGALSQKIDEERQSLVYLQQDLSEQESLIGLHKSLEIEQFRTNFEERMSQLERYRELKNSESGIEKLMAQFTERAQYEQNQEDNRAAVQSMRLGEFAYAKGALPLPVEGGRVISLFGRHFDGRSKIQVFRKGVELAANGVSHSAKSVFRGRVVFAGALPGYGNVAILDHGKHYYTLLGQLESIDKKVGDYVAQGETVGTLQNSGVPLYFEIRSRNVAVDPLQWMVQ